MTRSSKGRGGGRTSAASRTPSDAGFYLGFGLIGLFACALSYLVVPEGLPWVITGVVAIFALLVHVYAMRAIAGGRLANWQKALADASLRFAGYGRASGRPVEAAKGSASARSVVMVTALVSVVIVAAVGFGAWKWLG